jgi:hypothetical protein
MYLLGSVGFVYTVRNHYAILYKIESWQSIEKGKLSKVGLSFSQYSILNTRYILNTPHSVF